MGIILYTESIVIIAISVLISVFIGALFILVLICRRQRLYNNLCEKDDDDIRSRGDVLLIDPEMEVRLKSADLEEILADEQWIDDATGLVPHCIALLKICHNLSKHLTALALSMTSCYQIEEIARKICDRVDDVVRTMYYPPLDPRLLEARAAALILETTQLALLVRYKCCYDGATTLTPHSHISSFIEKSLAQMDTHLLVLREAALSQEAMLRIQNVVKNTSLL